MENKDYFLIHPENPFILFRMENYLDLKEQKISFDLIVTITVLLFQLQLSLINYYSDNIVWQDRRSYSKR